MGEVLSFGFNLAVSFPSDSRGSKARIVLLPSWEKDGVYIILLEFIPLHHVILPNALLCSYELYNLDACWIAVDVWSNSSRCRIVSVYLSGMWCLYTWSCLDILITMRFSINCSTVICSPTIDYAILREASSETYGPRFYFPSYKFPIHLILQSLLSNLYHTNTKNIYLIIISIRSHFCKWPWRDW